MKILGTVPLLRLKYYKYYLLAHISTKYLAKQLNSRTKDYKRA